MNYPWLVFANLLATFLAFSGIIFYVLVYTHWLKRHSTQNIVIGGAAGAIPALVGWAAVTDTLTYLWGLKSPASTSSGFCVGVKSPLQNVILNSKF